MTIEKVAYVLPCLPNGSGYIFECPVCDGEAHFVQTAGQFSFSCKTGCSQGLIVDTLCERNEEFCRLLLDGLEIAEKQTAPAVEQEPSAAGIGCDRTNPQSNGNRERLQSARAQVETLDRNPYIPLRDTALEPAFRRVPPQNIEFEMSLLGAILLDNSKINVPVTASDFYRESHREIYKAMRTLADGGHPIDALTVKEMLQRRGVSEAIAGGSAYILELAAFVPTAEHAEYYAARLRELATKREMISGYVAQLERTYNGSSIAELAEYHSRLTPPTLDRPAIERFPEPLKASAWYAREEQLYSRVTWIWDNILEGGGISVLAGKKGAGKSTFVRTLMLSGARGFPLLGRNMRASKVWYIDLEPGGSGRKQVMQDMGWCDDDTLTISTGSPMAGKPGLFEWLKERIEQNGYDLVIVDTMYKLLKIEGTNDYDKGIYGQVPIEEICRATGVHFMLIHHARKNPTAGGLSSIAEEILGSVSIAATAGTVMLIRKRPGGSTFQMDPPRYGEPIEGERVLKKLAGGWIEDAGTWGGHWLGMARQAVLEGLKLRGAEYSKAEDLDILDDNKPMPVKTKKWLLSKLYEDRQNSGIERIGEGKRGDPYRYRIGVGILD